jgi:hypothetical protein
VPRRQNRDFAFRVVPPLNAKSDELLLGQRLRQLDQQMRLLRIYSSPDGESHFDEIEVPQPPAAIFPGEDPLHVSSKYGTTGMQFITVPAGTC